MVEPLVVLAASVVKSVCKIWFRDDQLFADGSGAVIDLVQAKLSSSGESPEADELFAGMERKVATLLKPLLDTEFARVPANEREAAVLAVRASLDRARLATDDLLAVDLNAAVLEGRVRDGAGDLGDLSPSAQRLYERVLSECCRYIVAYADRIPGFTVFALAEVLRRQTRVLRVITAPERLPRSGESTSGIPEDGFTLAYRQQVANRLNRLELFGATLSDSAREYPLSTAYISLTVRTAPAAKLGSEPYVPETQDLPTTDGSEVRIEEALADTTRLLVRGDAGSGKTTLLQWLGVHSAMGDFGDNLRTWNNTVPFLIRLRSYAGRALPAPEQFLDDLGRNISATMQPGWVHDLLGSGRAVVLVDGIDELPEAQRDAARRWLSELVRDFPKAHYVVTSRPTAAGADWLSRAGFDSAVLRPLNSADTRLFIQHWHSALRAEIPTGQARADLREDERSLLAALDQKRHLRALAATPLLCALLCALHRDRRRQLPGNRLELYDAALQMLLDRRDRERVIPEETKLLSYTDKRTLLRELALWLIENGWSDAPAERVRGQLERQLRRMPNLTAEAATVERYLLDRSGLLREPMVGRIDFVHRTFQEYLAAEAAIDADKTGSLVANAHDDQWFEVIVTAVGHANRRQREELVQALVNRADDEPEHADRLRVAAIACLETVVDLPPDLYETVQSIAGRLLPPKSLAAAQALAAAGEAVLDLLNTHPPTTGAEAAATIRTAGLVGGDGAIPLIARAVATATESGDAVAAVREEALRAWPGFDRREFANRVLAPVLDALAVTDPKLTPILAELHSVERLSVSTGNVQTLEFTRNLRHLSWLSLNCMGKSADLSALSGHPALAELHLTAIDSPDLTALSAIPGLASVHVIRCRDVRNWESLQGCESLRTVSICNTDLETVGDLRIPANVTTLNCPSIVGMSSLKPLLGIGGDADIAHLDLSDNPWLTDLDAIGEWAGTLTTLNLTGCTGITDLTPIARLPHLRRLYINWLKPIDLTPLRHCENLTIHVDVGQRTIGSERLHSTSHLTYRQR